MERFQGIRWLFSVNDDIAAVMLYPFSGGAIAFGYAVVDSAGGKNVTPIAFAAWRSMCWYLVATSFLYVLAMGLR